MDGKVLGVERRRRWSKDEKARIVEETLAQTQERRACRSDAHLPAKTQEQLLLQFLLQEQNLAADRRLREMQTLPGTGE